VDEIFRLIGTLIKTLFFLVLSVFFLIAGMGCVALAILSLPLDLVVLVLSGGRGQFELSKASMKAARSVFSSITTLAENIYRQSKDSGS
jgi:hypothetical protein